MKATNALSALNHIENGGSVLVSLFGNLSSLIRMTKDGFEVGNSEIGIGVTNQTSGDLYEHFQRMLELGGELRLV